MIRSNGHNGLRKVIDVSGDGIETDPWFKKSIKMPEAKLLADRQRVTINGLAILTIDFPTLDQYYREEVIHGPGAFVVVADGFADFGRAIRQKLWQEISHQIAFQKRSDDTQLSFHQAGTETSGRKLNASACFPTYRL